MLIAGSLRCAATKGLHTFSHSSVQKLVHVKQSSMPLNQLVRGFARDTRFVNRSVGAAKSAPKAKTRSWKDILMQPATQTRELILHSFPIR